MQELLSSRGLVGEAQVEALLLLLTERPQDLLKALIIAPPQPMVELLEQCLVLSCGVGDCALVEGATALRVSPDHCEICGGSDAARAFHGFAEACRSEGVYRVVIVGGSPAYRKALKALAAPLRSELRVELVPGQAKHREKKIRGMARSADLVIIWCATILDHATTNAFVAAGAPILNLPHRGIATMLGAAAAAVRDGSWRC
jgi:hypothetical protein